MEAQIARLVTDKWHYGRWHYQPSQRFMGSGAMAGDDPSTSWISAPVMLVFSIVEN
jgi:hypothetical protein